MAEVNTSGVPEQSAPPETLILGKYKTQKELEDAYSEVQAEFTRRSQELAETKRQLGELQNRQVQVPDVLEEEDDDQLFFREPAKATQKVVVNALTPIYDFLYEQQKQALRSDPEFLKYEGEVDQLIAMQPQLKVKPGVVAQAFKMVKGLHFDPEEFKKQILVSQQNLNDDKRGNSLEGAAAPGVPERTEAPMLSDEEKRVALKFKDPGVSDADALKKYAENKVKLGGKA